MRPVTFVRQGQASRGGGWRWTCVLRWALAAVAIAQVVLGLSKITGLSHHDHEVAAWTIATGVGFLCVAIRPRQVAGVFAVLATGTAALLAVAVRDLATGLIPVGQEAPHLALLIGTVLLAVLWYGSRGTGPGGRVTTDSTALRRLRQWVYELSAKSASMIRGNGMTRSSGSGSGGCLRRAILRSRTDTG